MIYAYAHMCRDDHTQIGHNDSECELCPLCQANSEINQAMDMLGDVPGETLTARLTKLQGWYLEMQIMMGDLKHKLEVAESVNRLSALSLQEGGKP